MLGESVQITKGRIHLDTPFPSPFSDEAAPSQTATVGLEQMLQQAALRSIQASQLDAQQWEWERPINRSDIDIDLSVRRTNFDFFLRH